MYSERKVDMGMNLRTAVTTKKLEMKPVPLLVLLLSFDPKGAKSWEDGVQKMTTPKEYWHDICFGDEGYTLKNFYKEMSGGKFYFEPVKVLGSDTPGVLEITLNVPHPDRMNLDHPNQGHGNAFFCIAEALKAAAPYVDFASYDLDNDKYLSSDEFNVLLIHAGFDYSGGKEKTDELHWGVFANCGNLPDGVDQDGVVGAQAPEINGVKLCASGKGCYALVGEYRKMGGKFIPHPMGTMAHELGHSIGFHDVYDYDRKVTGWPLPFLFSLMGHGNYGNAVASDEVQKGAVPQHLDPFQKIRSGFAVPEIVDEDGEYVLHSISGDKANIIRVNTPDPKEYFLLENRQLNGFCAGLYRKRYVTNENGERKEISENYEKGGVIVWHIDEDIFDKYSVIKRTNGSGMWDPDTEKEGTTRHDPGIVTVFKNGFDENGILKNDGEFAVGFPEDPFFRGGDVFNSNEYVSAATHTRSLNSFPEGISQDAYNLKIEFIEDNGEDIKIRVTQTK